MPKGISSKFEELEKKIAIFHSMPSAICSNCGARFWGWALEHPGHQTCEKCGGELKIEEKEAKSENDQH